MQSILSLLLISLVLCSHLVPKQACKYVKRLKEQTSLSKVMFFDLDDTLYRSSIGVKEKMGKVMGKYIAKHVLLNDDEEMGKLKSHEYYKKYGLTVKGILAEKPGISTLEFEEFVDSHLQLEDVLVKREEVIQVVRNLKKARKWVLTNAGWVHTQRTLKLLGLEDEFEGVVHVDYGEMDFPAKPDVRAYQRAMEVVGPAPDGYYFADDNLIFVKMAKELGWKAIYVNESDANLSNTSIQFIENLPFVFPELFEE